VIAIVQIPERSFVKVAPDGPLRLLVLDGVQDPGNVGTMLRTAAALGVAATVALPGTVDLWNAKVVRSAMGSHFTHPAIMTTWEGLDRWRMAESLPLWGADAHGEELAVLSQSAPPRLALVVGNEGAGLTADARTRVARIVALPTGAVDSLNVAVAAGILMYELRG
jgi:TrmH family RNA methyltransferase